MRVTSTQEACTDFCKLLTLVSQTEEPVAIDEQGERVAVVISPAMYQMLEKHLNKQFWRTVDEIRERNADKDPDAEYAIITQVVEEVRQERYEEQQRESQGRR